MTDQKRKAMELSIAALLAWKDECPHLWSCYDRAAIDALHQALNVDAINTSSAYVDKNEKREHEPVAWMASDNKDIVYASELDDNTESRFNIPLYTTPTKRQWVGLTDEDKDLIAHKAEENDWHDYDVVNSTEAALKEKNT